MQRWHLTLALAFCAGIGSAARAVVIDDFSAGGFSLDSFGGPTTAEGFGLSGVIGVGDRDASMMLSGGDHAVKSNMNNHLGDGIAGAYVLTTDLKTTSGLWRLGYGTDIAVTTPNAPLNEDLTAGGATHLALDFSQVDSPIVVQVSLVSTNNNGGISLDNVVGPGTLLIPYSLYTPAGVDMTAIKFIDVFISLAAPGGEGNGFTIVLDQIATNAIPEPASLALLAAPALLLLRRRGA